MLLVRAIFIKDIPEECLLVSRRINREGGGGLAVGLSYPFSKIGQKLPSVFGKICPDVGHLWVKFLI